MNPIHYHSSLEFLRVTQVVAEAYGSSGPRREVMVKARSANGNEVVRRPHAMYISPSARRMLFQDAIRVDLGAVLLDEIVDQENATLIPFVAREFVLDVDKSKRARPCSCINGVCELCWRKIFFKQAQTLVDLLKRNLGVQHATAFFSGKKGFHVICSDAEILRWDGTQRRSVLSWLQQNTDVEFDEAVTRDPRHLSRCPLSLHQDTLNLMLPLDLRDPKPDIPFLSPPMSNFLPTLQFHLSNTLPQVYPS